MFLYRFELVNPPDGAWGRPLEDGTWSGLIGHALYGKSNWSMSGIAVSPEVRLGIKFSFESKTDRLVSLS